MSDAGLTNGAFYPHFKSKAELVRESVVAALDAQSTHLNCVIATDGPEAAIAQYLSPESRDNPDKSCALAALLPELAREPAETRAVYAERFQAMVNQIITAMPSNSKVTEDAVFGIYATMVGALQFARATEGTELSDRFLKAGIDAVRAQLVNVQI